jgi:hypothetical protein
MSRALKTSKLERRGRAASLLNRRSRIVPIAVCVFACSCGRSEQNKPAPEVTAPSAPTVSAAPLSASPSSSAARKPAVRLAPSSAFASTYIPNDHGHADLAALAFDGDPSTSWQKFGPAGVAEWIEASFDGPVDIETLQVVTGFDRVDAKLGDLFPLNAHIKKMTVFVDRTKVATIDVPRDDRAATVPVNRRGSRVRIVFDDVWPGTKWKNDLAITEIEVRGAPSEKVARDAHALLSPFYEALFVKGATWTYKGNLASWKGEGGDRKLQPANVTFRCTVTDVKAQEAQVISWVDCPGAPPFFPVDGIYVADDKGLHHPWSAYQASRSGQQTEADAIKHRGTEPLLAIQPKTWKKTSNASDEGLDFASKKQPSGVVAAWCPRGATLMGDPSSWSFCFLDGLPPDFIDMDVSPMGADSEQTLKVRLEAK